MSRRPVRCYAAGTAEGPALVLGGSLSFWGGVDAATGRIIDRSHADSGACITGAILVMPGGRDGSLWYYRALVDAFRANPAHPSQLVDELERTVTEMETLARAE